MEGLIVFISTESMRWRESFREQVFLMDAFALAVAVELQAIITILLSFLLDLRQPKFRETVMEWGLSTVDHLK